MRERERGCVQCNAEQGSLQMNVEDIKNRSNKIMEQLYRLFVHLLGFTDFLRL